MAPSKTKNSVDRRGFVSKDMGETRGELGHRRKSKSRKNFQHFFERSLSFVQTFPSNISSKILLQFY